MSTADLSVARQVAIDRALRGRRVDVWGLAFQGLLLLALLGCLAIIVTLLYTVIADGGSVYDERGFALSDWPGATWAAFTDVVDFVVHPIGILGWLFTLLMTVGLPAFFLFAFRHSVKLGLGFVGLVVGIFVFVGFVSTSDFITANLSRFPDQAGIAQGIVGSLMLAAMVILIATPLGIATAVYLEEYAPSNRFTNVVRLNIRNLAGVPSVVYGILGLTIFVQLLGTDIDSFPLIGGTLGSIFGEGGITGGRTIIAGGITLAIVVLPIVIITASEAIRAVPQSLREGGYGVGATKWEVERTLVLPNAFAGILTGTILSVSRAVGETAPLILVGAFYGTFFTTGTGNFWDKFSDTYTGLPMIIYKWAGEPSPDFRISNTAAAILALLAITLLANLFAILLRNHYEQRW